MFHKNKRRTWEELVVLYSPHRPANCEQSEKLEKSVYAPVVTVVHKVVTILVAFAPELGPVG